MPPTSATPDPGTDFEGERSGGTWRKYARIVRNCGPATSSWRTWQLCLDGGMERFSGTLSALGYDAEWSVLSACALGAPYRERGVHCGLRPRSLSPLVGKRERSERALKGVTRPSGHRITLWLTDLVKLRDGGLINPQWVEWLMGFPVDWTAWDTSETL